MNKSLTLVQPCTFCGLAKGHSDSSRVIREKECKAYAMTCSRPKPKNNAYNFRERPLDEVRTTTEIRI